MNPNVPAGAAVLLDFIYRTETSLGPPDCYEVVYDHRQGELARPLTSMTLDEVEAAQPGWTKRFGSSAAGAPQFMRNTLDAPGTLRDIEGEMGLSGNERFSPDLQDAMAFHLLKRRGYEAFVAGRLSPQAFGNNLAKEWASFPVLSTIKGARRMVKRGQSFYAGDGVNKSLTAPENVEAVLARALQLAAAPVPVERPWAPDSSAPHSGSANRGPYPASLVEAIQQALIDKGYPEVGRVDGIYGGRERNKTRDAILAFEADHGLPLTGIPTGELLATILAAEPRAQSLERATAPAGEVRANVPEAKATWQAQLMAFWGFIVTTVTGVIGFVGEQLQPVRESLRWVFDLFGDIPWWAYAALVAAGLLFAWKKLQTAQTQQLAAYRSGERR